MKAISRLLCRFGNFYKLMMFVSVSILLLSAPLRAKESFYGISSLGYIANEIENERNVMSLDTLSYKLGIGYEYNESWSFEAGYQALGEDILALDQLSLNNRSKEITGVYVSALGRARNRNGELFYRLGLMRAELSESYLSTAQTCPNNGQLLGMQGTTLLCQNSDARLAGVLGLGFDFYIHHSTLLRIEIEHIRGQDKYSANAIYVGFRLNF